MVGSSFFQIWSGNQIEAGFFVVTDQPCITTPECRCAKLAAGADRMLQDQDLIICCRIEFHQLLPLGNSNAACAPDKFPGLLFIKARLACVKLLPDGCITQNLTGSRTARSALAEEGPVQLTHDSSFGACLSELGRCSHESQCAFIKDSASEGPYPEHVTQSRAREEQF
jgi:hypothetical protein